MKLEQLSPNKYKVTDTDANVSCVFTVGDFNASQVWNFDGFHMDAESGQDVSLQLARVCRQIGEFVQSKNLN